EKTVGPGHPNVAMALHHLAISRAAVGQKEAALGAALRAVEIGTEHFLQTGRILTEHQALQYASIGTEGLDTALSLAADGLVTAGSREKVLDAVVRSRSLVLDEVAVRHRMIEGTRDPQVTKLASDLRKAATQLSNLAVRGVGGDSPEQYRHRLERAVDEKARIERAL